MPIIDRDIIEATVFTVVADQWGVSKNQLTRQTHFINDLNADELDGVELVMELEEQFDIRIPDEDSEKLLTVGEVIDYVAKAKGVA